MKKLKQFFLISVIILFVTGCEVNYNLEFIDSELSENIEVNLNSYENNSENIEKLKYGAQYEAYAIAKRTVYEKYNFTYQEKKDSFIGNFEYKYSVNNFNDANVFNQCYDSFNFVFTDNEYSIVTSDTFKCVSYGYIPVDKYTITITTNHIVNSHNADLVDNNKYIWIINNNGETTMKKPIKITFAKATRQDLLKENLSNNSSTALLIVLGIVLLSFVTVGIVFIIKNKRVQD